MKIASVLIAVLALLVIACKGKSKNDDKVTSAEKLSAMPMYVIERDLPGAGKFTQLQLKEISQKSCAVLKDIGVDIEWDHSYVAEDKIYCVYRTNDTSLIRKHAELAGFPANKITYAGTIISPRTAQMEVKE